MNKEKCYFCRKAMGNSTYTINVVKMGRVPAHSHCRDEKEREIFEKDMRLMKK